VLNGRAIGQQHVRRSCGLGAIFAPDVEDPDLAPS
jgi:hypothetical protein